MKLTPTTRKDNDTRYGLDIDGQDPESVNGYVAQFTNALELIYRCHDELRMNADRYTAVWDRLKSHQRTALRKILSELPA